MSRVFLLSANVTTEPYPVYPLGMAVIAGALDQAGHQLRQFDFLAAGKSKAALRQALAEFAPEFVCLSLRNIDNVDSFGGEDDWYLAQARKLVQVVREATAATLIVGGPAFSIMPEAILDYLGADHGVVGEGERVLVQLLADLKAGRPAARLTSEAGAGLAGEEMAAPLLVPELVEFYRQQTGMVNLQSKRGCPFSCSYCTYPGLEGKRFRCRPAPAVVDDIKRLQAEHGIESLFFTDSIFNDPAGHYLAVAEEMIRRGVQLRWSAFFRPQGLGRSELALLKKAGLYALELGTDAASDATLAGLAKGFNFAEVEAVNRACVDEQLPCAHFVIFGGPGETEATVQEGLANLARLQHTVVFAFSGIRLLSKSPLHAQAIREGLVSADQSLLQPVYYYSPNVDRDVMNATIEESFRGRRDRIFPPSEGQKRMAVMHNFGYRGLLWDKLISFGRSRRRHGAGN
ncbi:lipid biosynthesis B12-binding/radical SAM protein [Trichloromonas sp.]|uniref:lipid biosynthesis B12-binding/radical SAM protein n=1 Tax=Trichloromonas sp. TaxID=3069249 RepID=UPI003D8132EA